MAEKPFERQQLGLPDGSVGSVRAQQEKEWYLHHQLEDLERTQMAEEGSVRECVCLCVTV